MRIKTKNELLATGWKYQTKERDWLHPTCPYYIDELSIGQRISAFGGWNQMSILANGKNWYLDKEMVVGEEENIAKLLKRIDETSR